MTLFVARERDTGINYSFQKTSHSALQLATLRFQCLNRFEEVAAIPFFTVSVNCNLHFDGPKHFEQY